MKNESNQFDTFLGNVHKGLEPNLKTQPESIVESTTETYEPAIPEESAKVVSVKTVEPLKRKRKSQEDYQGRFFTRVDFTHRKPLYITAATHRRLMRIVHLMDGSRATISSYVENILINHLDIFKEDINAIYQENSTNPTED